MRESSSSNRGAPRASGRNSVAPPRTARPGRGAKSSSGHSSFSLRRAIRWTPVIGKLLFVICAAVLLIAGYRAVASASYFRAGSIDITGAERASSDRIAAVVKRRATTTNVWQLNLNEVSSEIEKEPWVRAAIVSRVLPGGLRVRITERVPAVVVRTSNGQLMWVDEDAVLLARVAPTDELPPFFLRGYDETLTTAAQAENRRRISEAIKMIGEWRQAGVVDRVSEVNVEDLRDVRTQLAGRDSVVEVRLGANNYGTRLLTALEVLDARRGAGIIRLDATMLPRGNVIVGVNKESMSKIPAVIPSANDARRELNTTPTAASPVLATASPANRTIAARVRESLRPPSTTLKTKPRDERKTSPSASKRRADERRLARESERKEAKREAAKPKTTALTQRPRRVG